MPSRDQRLLVLLSAVTSVAVLALAVVGQEDLLAYATPWLVLALPLLGGRYVGEEQIARAAGRRRRRGEYPSLNGSIATWTALVGSLPLPRGGHLIARALAKRPPPVTPLA